MPSPSGYTVNGTDLDNIFTQTGTKDAAAPNYAVATADLNTRYAKSVAVADRSSTTTNYRVNGSDLNTIFRRAEFLTVSVVISGDTIAFWNNVQADYSVTNNPPTLDAAASNGTGAYSYVWTNLTTSGPLASIIHPNPSSRTCTLSAQYYPFEFSNTFQCVVTDTGTSETTSGTITVTFTE